MTNILNALRRDIWCQIKWTVQPIAQAMRDGTCSFGKRLSFEANFLKENVYEENLGILVVTYTASLFCWGIVFVLSNLDKTILDLMLIGSLIYLYGRVKGVDFSKSIFVRGLKWKLEFSIIKEYVRKLGLVTLIVTMFVCMDSYNQGKVPMLFGLSLWTTFSWGVYFYLERGLEVPPTT